MSEEIKLKSEPADDIDIPENFFDDLTSNKFLDDLVSCIPVPKKEVLSEGECTDEEESPPQNVVPPTMEKSQPAQSVELPPLLEKTQSTQSDAPMKQSESGNSLSNVPEQKPAATISEKPPAVTVPEKLPAVTTPERLPVANVPEKLPSTSALEKLPPATAPEKLPPATAPEKVPSAATPEKMPPATAPEKPPSTPVPEKPPSTPVPEKLPAATVVPAQMTGNASIENKERTQPAKTVSNNNAAVPPVTIKSEPVESHQTNTTSTETGRIATTLPKPIIQMIKSEPGGSQSQPKPTEQQFQSTSNEQQTQSKPVEKRIKAEPVFQPPEPEPLYQPPEPETLYQPPEPESVYQPPSPDPMYQPPEAEPMYQPPDPESMYQAPGLDEPMDLDPVEEIIPKPKIKNFPIPMKMNAPSIKREKKSPSPPIQMIPFKRIKLEKQSNTHIEKAYKTCMEVLRTFKEEEKRRFITKFVYTPTTIRIKNLDDEYQSPLLRNNNIEFNFTSTNSKIDFRKMSIMRFGKEVTRVVDLLGLDINTVAKKVLRTESTKSSSSGQSTSTESSSGQYYAPFYNEVATQTETIACNECLIRKLRSHKDKEVMAKPQTAGIGIQTGMENELPIMSIITTLNTYQQVALNDFAEVMKEPPPTDPNDIYRLRERLMDILNLSRRSVSQIDDPRPRSNVYVQRAPTQNMMPMPMSQPNMPSNAYPYPGSQQMMHQAPSGYHENEHHMMAPRAPNFPQNHQNMMPQHQGYPHPQLKREHASHMMPGTSRPSEDPRRRQRPPENMQDPNYMSSYQLQNQHEMQPPTYEEMPSMAPPYANRSFGRGGKIMRK